MIDMTKFYAELFEVLHSQLKLTKSKDSVLFDGITLRRSNLERNVLSNPALLNLKYKYKTEITDGIVFGFKTYALAALNARIADRKANRDNLSEDIQHYSIGVDIITGKHHVLKDGGIQPLEYETWLSTLDMDDQDILNASKILMSVRFDPHKGLSWNGKILTTTESMPMKYYNTYIKPEWMRRDPPKTLPDFHKKYTIKYFESLFPKKEERLYAVNWIHKLKTQRMEDMLVFIGKPGNGKNTFMRMCEAVVGSENTSPSTKKLAEKEFNAELKGRKLVCFDESSLTGSKKDSIKAWMNETIVIESKGFDGEKVENHASFILATNDYRSVYLEHTDRRFSVLTLGERNLDDVFGKDGNRTFQNWIRSEEFALTFPYLISSILSQTSSVKDKTPEQWYLKYLEYERIGVVKGDAFYKQVELSKASWFKAMKGLLLTQEFVTIRDVRKFFNKVGYDAIDIALEREEDERRQRGIKPYKVCEKIVDLDGVRYVSIIQEKVVTANADSF
jgi:hypothetical protein